MPLEAPTLPSSFAIVQLLSESVLRHWPPSTALRHRASLEANCAWHSPYDAALLALRNLQEDIAVSLNKTACVIIAARNSASPIQRLPLEVVRQIFMHLGGDVQAKISLTHTCSAWRDLIIDDPFMWTAVDLDTVRTSVIASKIFRRAREFPLHLTCHDWSELRLNCASFELGRVEELDTTFTVPMFRNLCKRGAPLLKRFRIAIPRHSNMITYLPYLFAQTHPALTDLTMVDCRLVFNADNYRGLTRLDIRFSRPMMSLRQDEDFLYIFRGCPDLEEVRLENMNLYRDLQDQTDVIHLARLRMMHLRLSSRDMACLLSSVSAPLSLRLSMITYGPHRMRGADAPEPAYPTLQILGGIRQLEADHAKGALFAFREVDSRSPSFCRKIEDIATQGSPISDMLLRLACTYTMPHLLKLRVRDIDSIAVAHFLRRCSTIRTLEIISSDEGIGNTTIIHEIMQALRSSDDSFLPELQTLALERVHMDVDALFDLVELGRTCPLLCSVHLHVCRGELSSDEMVAILEGEFCDVRLSSQSLVVEGLPHNDLEHAP